MPADSSSAVRRSDRKPVRLTLMLIAEQDAERSESEAVTFDFSRYGVGVKSGAVLRPGQVVDVVPREGLEYAVRGRVVWVGAAGDGQGCSAGLEFLAPLPEAG